MYEHEIANVRLDASLKRNEQLTQHIYHVDKVIRAICTELNINYAGADLDFDEILAAIKKLKASN